MPVHKPLVILDGQVQELPATSGVFIGELPAATDALPDLFLVRQAGAWVGATLTQLRGWLAMFPQTQAGWDNGASIWDLGTSFWDVSAAPWDNGASVWDGGTSIWTA